MLAFEDIASLPRWILRTVEKGEVDKALRLVDFLNTTPDSPWFGKIHMANTDGESTTVHQRSFVKAVIKYVLTANNPVTALKDFEKEGKVFLNYWRAIAALLDDGEPSTLYKYNGVELFCRFSIPFFTRMMDKASFTVDAMRVTLESCFESMDGEYAGVGHAHFWATRGKAGQLNSAALSIIVQEMASALHKAGLTSEVEI